MRKIMVLFILIALLLLSGCTSYFSNLSAPKTHLKLHEQAIFEKEGCTFTASIDRIDVKEASPSIRDITVYVNVKNTGTKGISLNAYPKLIDASGAEYSGKNIFLGAVNPGYSATGYSTMTIRSNETYNALRHNASLKIQFRDLTPIPYEASWIVDFDTLN